MKRMNVREFRKNISHLENEPVEVVRYAETIGFWIPREMTLEPAKPVIRPVTKKWSAVKAAKGAPTKMTAETYAKEIEEISRKVEAFMKAKEEARLK